MNNLICTLQESNGTLTYLVLWCFCWLVLEELRTPTKLMRRNCWMHSKAETRMHYLAKRTMLYICTFQILKALLTFFRLFRLVLLLVQSMFGAVKNNQKQSEKDWDMFFQSCSNPTNSRIWSRQERTRFATQGLTKSIRFLVSWKCISTWAAVTKVLMQDKVTAISESRLSASNLSRRTTSTWITGRVATSRAKVLKKPTKKLSKLLKKLTKAFTSK